VQNGTFAVYMMQKRSKNIPVNTLPAGIREGIYIATTSFDGLPDAEEVVQPHRDNGHLFILQEKGTTHIEIDFQKHEITAPSIIYINPEQVHRLIAFDNATVSSWIITSENLQQDNLNILEELKPVAVLPLSSDTLHIISATASLCIRFYARNHEKLYNSILKESLNTLVALVASQYLAGFKPIDNYVRFELITKSFKSTLEHEFKSIKSPAEYAERQNISTPYLNQCVKAATGQSVSHHIQQRVALEAKRLLYHSNKSVKEIAGELGYDDYSYFTRLFVKVTGMTPLTFRSKNFE